MKYRLALLIVLAITGSFTADATTLKELYQNYSMMTPEQSLMPHWREIDGSANRFIIHTKLRNFFEGGTFQERKEQLELINILLGELLASKSKSSSHIIPSINLVEFRSLVLHEITMLSQLEQQPANHLPEAGPQLLRSATSAEFDWEVI